MFFTARLCVDDAAGRVLGVPREARSVYALGPRCVDSSGSVQPQCAGSAAGVADARVVRVTTHVDGARDDLMPVSRTIALSAAAQQAGAATAAGEEVTAVQLDVFDVGYEVFVPGVTHVASPWREAGHEEETGSVGGCGGRRNTDQHS